MISDNLYWVKCPSKGSPLSIKEKYIMYTESHVNNNDLSSLLFFYFLLMIGFLFTIFVLQNFAGLAMAIANHFPKQGLIIF